MKLLSPAATCPCGSAQSYLACCLGLHDGTRPAETAEALMRSRYSAFAVADGRYLAQTAAAGTDAAALSAWASEVTWLSLSVTARERGGPGDSDGTVTFTARYLEDGAVVSLTERSSFERRDGGWCYVGGEPRVTRAKVGRNDPCPCGSGRKLKACHA